MGYYNMAEGDAPILKDLAEQYAISDNYHQAVQGGTGANHIALGTGTAASYQDAAGRGRAAGWRDREPEPQAGHQQQLHAGRVRLQHHRQHRRQLLRVRRPAHPASGPSSTTCPRSPTALNNCQPGRYYLLNNYNPGLHHHGRAGDRAVHIPPQPRSGYVTIGDALSARHISWAWFGEGYNNGSHLGCYCGICDPMQYSASIMTNPALRANIQHDLRTSSADARAGTLPAVSFLKPQDDDGHPGYSSVAAFENFLHNAISAVQSNPREWASTAIFITWDEGGGSYDSGYIQPVSFLGDGPRVPLIVVSPWARHGAVDHTYNDHVSILKFIEQNWGLPPLTSFSEDNLPNPTPEVYVPRRPPGDRRPDDPVRLRPSLPRRPVRDHPTVPMTPSARSRPVVNSAATAIRCCPATAARGHRD